MPIPLPAYAKTANRADLADASEKARNRRQEVVARFPIDAWPTMPVERYALGTDQSQDSFSYMLEYGSNEIGGMGGGNASKHLIYFGKKENTWKFDTAKYSSAADSWQAIRDGFCQAIKLGQAGRFEEVDGIAALDGAEVVKAKFLSIYFPDAILPIFSRKHIRHFLESLGEEVSAADYERSIRLNLRLARRLGQIPEIADLDNDERLALLYRWNPPTRDEEQPKLIKIAPGEGASFWESDCLPGGIMCVGWDDVGDLRQFADFAAFRSKFAEAYGEEYNGHEGTITRKAKELWLLRDLEEGDLIAANKGISEILSVGEVQAPGYVWDASRDKHKHTVKVEWDLERSGPIERVPKWVNITLEKLTGELRERILAVKSGSSPTIAPVAADNLSAPTNPTNRIYYGPPGTGKTHELRRIQETYTEKPQVGDRRAWLDAIVASMAWREVIAAALASLGASRVPSIHEHELIKAKARSSASRADISNRIWGALQKHTPLNVETVKFENRSEPYIFTKSSDAVWSLLPKWRQEDECAAALHDAYTKGPGHLPALPQTDLLAAIEQPANPMAEIVRYRTVTFHPSYCYEDFVRGIRPVGTEDEGRTEFRMVDGVFKQICDEARANPTKRYALFIDEINRGNIAKIFGELITLIEPDKRITIAADGSVVSGMTVQLPGSNIGEVAEPPFGVPANLDLYGTMNTADRSIALLDIALRRRFEFVEMPPRYEAYIFPTPVAGVDRGALLRRINDRLEYLLDRDHRIGHAYLMKAQSLADLRSAFANQIIPLLQEYFFDDLGKVALTLSGPEGTSTFVRKEELSHAKLFAARSGGASGSRFRYLVTDPVQWTAEAFQSIYASTAATLETEIEDAAG